MIPPIIHYCWFSNEEKTELVKRCIESWHKILPDYIIKCWDSNSFDFNSVDYVREAMEAKAYAHASDYIRLYALYTEGGIYLDSDVEVFKTFDNLLDNRFFSGIEQFPIYHSRHKVSLCTHLQAAIMGSEKQHPFIKECIDNYDSLHFKNVDGTYDYSEIPERITTILESYGFERTNCLQKIKDGITIYPNDVIASNDKKEVPDGCIAFHWGVKSWGRNQNRGKIYQFCWNHDMMELYHHLEKIMNLHTHR